MYKATKAANAILNRKSSLDLFTAIKQATLNSEATQTNNQKTISLTASTPILQPPQAVAMALSESCEKIDSEVKYYSSRSALGIQGLREATLNFYQSNGFNTNKMTPLFTRSEHDLIILLGNYLHKWRQSTIMTIPTFGLFFNAFYNKGLQLDLYKLPKENGWRLTPSMLEAILSSQNGSKAGLFVFINPDNPTGNIYNKSEVEALAQKFIDYNKWRKSQNMRPLFVLADEASRRIVLDKNTAFHNIGAIKGMDDFTLTSSGSSKDLAPGLAISHTIGPSRLIDELLHPNTGDPLPNFLITDHHGPSYPSQELLRRIFNGDFKEEFDLHVEKSVEIYRKNIDKIQKHIEKINSKLKNKFYQKNDENEFLEIALMPQGGLQILIQASAILGLQHQEKIINSSSDLANYIEKEAGVKILPGELCGFDEKEMMFRITISKGPEVIDEAFKKIEKCLMNLEMAKSSVKNPQIIALQQGLSLEKFK